MDFKRAINIEPAENPIRVLSGPEFVTLQEALKSLYQINNTNHVVEPVHVESTCETSKQIDDVITTIYHELVSYWSEFGIMDKCSYDNFKKFLLGVCNVDASGVSVLESLDAVND